MKNKFTNLMAGILVSSSLLYPSWVKNPITLHKWLQVEFTYQEDEDGYFKTPEETVKDKGGDCEDFAFLVDKILTDLGYETHARVISFSNRNTMHAICIIKQDGKFTYFSDNVYMPQKHNTIAELLTNNYPYWNYSMRFYFNKTHDDLIWRKVK